MTESGEGRVRLLRCFGWCRLPVIHFLMVGALLLAAERSVWPPAERDRSADSRAPIVITRAEIDDLRSRFRSEIGRVPTEAEEARLVSDSVDEELLYREALARGLGRGDRSVRYRVLQKMQALQSDESTRMPEALVQEGFSLGLADDAIIRRMLAEKVRLLVAMDGPPPDEAALRAFYARTAETYRQPPRQTLRHVFLSSERRGHAVDADARRVLTHLLHAGIPPAQSAALGDVFPFGHRFVSHAERDLTRRFGRDCAKRMAALDTGTWSKPIPSPFGRHLVWVEQVVPGALPSFESIHGQLAEAWRSEQRPARIERTLARLRTLYAVRVERPDGDRTS